MTGKYNFKQNILMTLVGKLYLPGLMFAAAMFLFSCSSSKQVITWNVELKESEIPMTDRCDPDKKLTSIKSGEKPELIPSTEDREGRVKVFGIPCYEGEDAPVYEVPMNRVKRITYVSDPLMPPTAVDASDLDVIEGCCRVRDGLWFFDKFAIRGAIGYRGANESVTYPSPAGDVVYESEFIGFDRGGSTITLGFELEGMWNARFIDPSERLQLGFITGVWPVDGSMFVPLGLHTRYTFNQRPERYSGSCNTWYLYGNAGLPLDFQTGAPLFGSSFDYQRVFYGLGIGHEWAISCDMDFALDLGYRYMNLPLPEIECCPTTPDDKRHPFRSSNVLLLRFGLTW